MKKSLLTSLAAATAVSLAAFAYGAPPPSSSDPQSTPPQSAPAQSTGSASPSARLEGLVPQGMTAQQACAGFNSVSDCAVTLHIAQNLQIPFPELKSKLASGQSIIAAIGEMKPGADPQAEVQKAATQTRSDMGGGAQ